MGFQMRVELKDVCLVSNKVTRGFVPFKNGECCRPSVIFLNRFHGQFRLIKVDQTRSGVRTLRFASVRGILSKEDVIVNVM